VPFDPKPADTRHPFAKPALADGILPVKNINVKAGRETCAWLKDAWALFAFGVFWWASVLRSKLSPRPQLDTALLVAGMVSVGFSPLGVGAEICGALKVGQV